MATRITPGRVVKGRFIPDKAKRQTKKRRKRNTKRKAKRKK